MLEIEKPIIECIESNEDGTYGKCIDCKEEINEERLTAIPYTLRCINCMSKYEDKKRREKM